MKTRGIISLTAALLAWTVFAADPVAVWTDFSQLTSNGYTLDLHGNNVNADGSVTIGSSQGISLTFSSGDDFYGSRLMTVFMEISNAPTANADKMLLNYRLNNNNMADKVAVANCVGLRTNNSALKQSWNGGGAYGGSPSWTPANRQVVAFSYDGGGSGSTTYLDGGQVATDSTLKTGSGYFRALTLGDYTDKDGNVSMVVEGLVIHRVTLFNAQLSAAEIRQASGYIAVENGATIVATGEKLYAATSSFSSPTSISGEGTLLGDFQTDSTLTLGGTFGHAGNVMLGACTGGTQATVSIQPGADITVSHLRMLNSANTSDSVELHVAGTLRVDSVSTNPNVWEERGSYKGILFGHWHGTGTYAIHEGGALIGEAAYLQAVFTAEQQEVVVDGGTLRVRGIQANKTGSSLELGNGGRLELAEGFYGSAVSQTYGTGTIAAYSYGASEGWTDSQAVAFTSSDEGTVIDPAGLTITFSGAVTGGGKVIVNDSVGGGTVVFSGNLEDYTGQMSVLSGTLDLGANRPTVAEVASGAALRLASSGSATPNQVLAGYTASAEIPFAGSSVDGTILLDGVAADASLDGGTVSASVEVPGNPTATGAMWWWDYEFNGSNASIGSDTGTMTLEGSGTSYTAADASGNQALYFQKTPYRSATFSNKSALTAVMYCQPGNYANTVLIGFGTTYSDGVAVALVTGDHPDQGDMKLVLIRHPSGQDCVVTTLADLSANAATETMHLYAFVMETITENATEKTQISIYLDGGLVSVYKHGSKIAITDGFQIGSLYGGVKDSSANVTWNTGLSKYPSTGDSGTVDFIRVMDGTLTTAAMRALAQAYPYRSTHGTALRTLSGSEAWVDTDAWTQYVYGSDTATLQTEPNDGTQLELTSADAATLTYGFGADVTKTYESLVLDGAGAITLKPSSGFARGVLKVAGRTTVNVDATLPVGNIALGVVEVSEGVTLTFDPMHVFTREVLDAYFAAVLAGATSESPLLVPLTGMVVEHAGAAVQLKADSVANLASSGIHVGLVHSTETAAYSLSVYWDASPDLAVTYMGGTETWMVAGYGNITAPATIPATYAGTVTLNNRTTDDWTVATAILGGNVVVSNAGTVSGERGAVVCTGALSPAHLTVQDGTTLAVAASLAGEGAILGSGTIVVTGNDAYQGINRAALADGEAWTGTVCLRGFSVASWVQDVYPWADYVTDGIVQNYPYSVGSLGNANSTIELDGLSSGSYLTIGRTEIVSTLKITGTNAISGGFSVGEEGNSYMYGGRTVVSGPVVGDGTLSLSGAGDQWFLSGALDGFAGTLFVAANKSVVIGSTDPDLCQSATVVVADGATLDNGFTVDSALSLASGSVLDASEGAVTVTGAVAFGENVTVKAASAPDADGVQVLAAANSGLDEGTVLRADIQAGGETLAAAVIVAREGGLYVVKPVVPAAVADEAVADAIAKAAAAAGVASVTLGEGYVPDVATLFHGSIAVSGEGEATTSQPVFGVSSAAVRVVGTERYVVLKAEAVGLAEGGRIELTGGTEVENAAEVREALGLENGASEGVATAWFVLPLPGEDPVSYGVRATNE